MLSMNIALENITTFLCLLQTLNNSQMKSLIVSAHCGMKNNLIELGELSSFGKMRNKKKNNFVAMKKSSKTQITLLSVVKDIEDLRERKMGKVPGDFGNFIAFHCHHHCHRVYIVGLVSFWFSSPQQLKLEWQNIRNFLDGILIWIVWW